MVGSKRGGGVDDSMSSAEANQTMLRAIDMGDTRGVRRALMEASGAWLAGPECRSDDPSVNAALAALLSPLGTGCIEEFDYVFGDMRQWTYRGWNSAHWAVAYKNEAALVWALKGVGKSGGDGLSLIDKESEDESNPAWKNGRGVMRSALALAVQLGDPAWLSRVLEVSTQSGADVVALARLERNSDVSALGVALFEWADSSRRSEDGVIQEGRAACVHLLHGLGFQADGKGASAGKLCVAMALSCPGQPELNSTLASAARLACALGSGTFEAEDGSKTILLPYEAAGAALDADWARALDLCGLSEDIDGSFAAGASMELASQLAAERVGTWASRRGAGEIAKRVEESLSAHPLAAADSPLGGLELQTVRWMIESEAGKNKMSLNAFRESVELALASAPRAGLASKKGSLRV